MEANTTISPFLQDRIAYATKCIEAAAFEKKPKVQDEAMQRKAYVLKYMEDIVMVHFVNTDITPGLYKQKFADNYVEFVSALMAKQKFGKFKMTLLHEENGVICMHQRIEVPIPFVDPRSTIVKVYQIPEDNGFTLLVSSRDCKEEEQTYKALIGKDILSTIEVNYYRFEALPEGKGSKVTHVNCTKPNGKFPDVAISKMTAA